MFGVNCSTPSTSRASKSMWKIADVTPLLKVKQVTDPKKELRPISLTSTLSKISENFIVTDYIKPALESLVDSNQFGTISGSSTVLALISMIHKWLEATDGNGASVRVLLFDYRKAFDLIDHKILVNKLKKVNIPNSVINWVIYFLSGRSLRVKLGKDCLSEWGTVPSGVPQGTKLGAWLFLLTINDLTVPSIFNMWKYVDDTTVSESIPKGQQSKSQEALDAIYDWSKENLFQLNGEKTKELIISFSRDSPQLPRVCIDGTLIKSIQSTKLLGLTINDTLRPSKRKTHVSRPDFYKKRERAGGFFCYLLFPIICFLYTLLPSPRDTLELLGQILNKTKHQILIKHKFV